MPASNRLYLDYNATAPLRACARQAIEAAMARMLGNPSSPHAEGRAAFGLLDTARQQVAVLVGARPDDVVLTSGGTEAVNAMIVGTVRAAVAAGRPKRLGVTATDHGCVLATATALQHDGFEVRLLPVDAAGRMDMAALRAALADGVLCVVTHWANNETGVTQDLDAIGVLATEYATPLLVDAVQAAGKLPLDFNASPAAACAVSAHKIGGPAGAGALVVRSEHAWAPSLHGGPQERGRRAGTEPLLAAVGFGAAATEAAAEAAAYASRVGPRRDHLMRGLRAVAPDLVEHGAQAERVANTANFRIPGWPGERIVQRLDLEGLALSTGAACAAGAVEPSHVLVAMGLAPQAALEAVRISLGYDTIDADIERAIALFRTVAAEWGRR